MEDIFVHDRALCESRHIGKGTRVWAFVHILPQARIGLDCNICDGVFIENDVCVGDRVTIKCGVQLWDGITIEDDVFIGPNATFTNDRFPRSKTYPETFLRTVVRRGASIGANATILPGIEIGPGAFVGAGAVATRSVPPNAIVVGNPARIVGYVDADEQPGTGPSPLKDADRKTVEVIDTGVRGVRLFKLPQFRDVRGDLSVGEFERNIPFHPNRYFVVYNVPSRETRGEHAHKACHQFLICLAGTCNVLVDDGVARREFVLDRPTLGIHIPPMIWGTQYNYSGRRGAAGLCLRPLRSGRLCSRIRRIYFTRSAARCHLSPAAVKFKRFVIAGICNTGLTYGLYLGLLAVTNYMIAYGAAYVLGIVISYLLNSLFVFNTGASRRTALRFPLIYVFQYASGSVVLWFLVRTLGVDEKIALVIVILSNALLTFVLMRKLFEAKPS